MHAAAPCATTGVVATFCLIHGQWHDASCWDPVVASLRAAGHEALAPDMPFDDPRAGYAQRAGPAIDALSGVEAPIVVGHSIASAEAALVAAERPVALLVHICPRFGGFATPAEAPAAFRTGFPFPPRDALGRTVWDPQAAVEVMYRRLQRDTALALARRLRPGAAPVGPYPLERHPDVPAALVYALDDEFFTPEWERYVARELLGVEPIAIAGGHFPMAEGPGSLAGLLDRLASDASPLG